MRDTAADQTCHLCGPEDLQSFKAETSGGLGPFGFPLCYAVDVPHDSSTLEAPQTENDISLWNLILSRLTGEAPSGSFYRFLLFSTAFHLISVTISLLQCLLLGPVDTLSCCCLSMQMMHVRKAEQSMLGLVGGSAEKNMLNSQK